MAAISTNTGRDSGQGLSDLACRVWLLIEEDDIGQEGDEDAL